MSGISVKGVYHLITMIQNWDIYIVKFSPDVVGTVPAQCFCGQGTLTTLLCRVKPPQQFQTPFSRVLIHERRRTKGRWLKRLLLPAVQLLHALQFLAPNSGYFHALHTTMASKLCFLLGRHHPSRWCGAIWLYSADACDMVNCNLSYFLPS